MVLLRFFSDGISPVALAVVTLELLWSLLRDFSLNISSLLKSGIVCWDINLQKEVMLFSRASMARSCISSDWNIIAHLIHWVLLPYGKEQSPASLSCNSFSLTSTPQTTERCLSICQFDSCSVLGHEQGAGFSSSKPAVHEQLDPISTLFSAYSNRMHAHSPV